MNALQLDYPRTCRNGHTISGPHEEHQGHHRQCKRCRLESQKRANERYDWPEQCGLPNTGSRSGFCRRLRKAISYNNLSLAALEEKARTKYGDEWLKTLYADHDAELEREGYPWKQRPRAISRAESQI